MTSVEIETTKSTAKAGWFLFIMLVGTLLSAAVILTNQSTVDNNIQAEPAIAQIASTSPNKMTASTALATNQPTLFFFYPMEMCQIRYCRQADQVASELRAYFGQQINFVKVPIHAIPDEEMSYLTAFSRAEWDLSPAVGVHLLPEVVMTPHGWSQAAPMAVLVGANQEVLYQGGEFFDVADLRTALTIAESN